MPDGAGGARAGRLVRLFRDGPDLPVAACYLSYFGLAFFALRWWRMADRRRPQRFSLFAVLAAGFWGSLLLLLLAAADRAGRLRAAGDGGGDRAAGQPVGAAAAAARRRLRLRTPEPE